MLRTQNKPRLFVLIILVSFGTIGGILFSPALPSLSAYFGISLRQAQLTMTAFLLTYAFGQLPYGPLSNRFGRKPAISIGCVIAFIGSLICALSKYGHSFNALLVGRMVQGLGCAVGLKMAFTIVADVFDVKAGAKINSYLIMAFAIVPGIGTIIGGALAEHMGWETTFVFLMIYTVVVYSLSMTLPETLLEKHPDALKVKQIFGAYMAKLKNRQILLCGTIIGMGTIYTYIFAAKAPFFGIQRLGMHPDAYGLYYCLAMIGMVVGSLSSARLAEILSPLKAIILGLSIVMLGTLSFFLLLVFNIFNGWTLFIPYSVMILGSSISYANCITYGLSKAQNKSNASALISFLNIGIGFVGTLASGVIGSTNPLFTAGAFFIISIVTTLLWVILYTIKK